MSTGWKLLSAMQERFNARMDASVSFTLPDGMESGDYLAVGVSDPESAGRPATAFTSNLEWSSSIAPEGPFDEVGEVCLAAVSIQSDSATAVEAVFALFDQTVEILRDLWVDHDLLGVPGLWDLKPSALELNTAQFAAGAGAYLLIRYSFQATI